MSYAPYNTAEQVLSKYKKALLTIEGVKAFFVACTQYPSNCYIVVQVAPGTNTSAIPQSLDGVLVKVQVVGQYMA